MLAHLISYASALLIFLAADAAWLGTMTGRLYRPHLAPLLADKFQLAPAAAFYLIYVLGAVVLAIAPAIAAGQATRALWAGAMLGLAAYSTYNLTNWAILKGWSPLVSYADIAWGTVATAFACWAAAAITMALSR